MQHSWPSSFDYTFFFTRPKKKKKKKKFSKLISIQFLKNHLREFVKNKSILFPLVIISGFLITFFSWLCVDFVSTKLIVVTIEG